MNRTLNGMLTHEPVTIANRMVPTIYWPKAISTMVLMRAAPAR